MESSYYLLYALSGALCLLVAIYPDRCVGTRRANDLPGPRPWPVLGNTFGLFLRRKNMLQHLSTLQAMYGEAFTFTMPTWGRTLVVNMPQWIDVIKKGNHTRYGKGPVALAIFAEFPGLSAFGTEGDTWRLSRKISAPLYSVKATSDHVVQSMAKILPVARSLLAAAADENVEIDWNDFAGRLALMVFCETALSLPTEIMTGELACLARTLPMMDAIATMNQVSSSRLFNPYWKWTEMLDGTNGIFGSARQIMYNIIDKIVNERRSKSQETDSLGNDFLGSLLRSPQSADLGLVRGTMMSLLFAGRDNIQNVLAWSMWEMSRSPSWFDRMRSEAIALRHLDGVLPYESISDFHVHLAVFYETLRLWPGVPKNARLALQDDVLPPISEHALPAITVRKGDTIMWSDFDMMRNEKVWGKSATIFDPGRHLDCKGKFVRPKAPAFHSFGSGPRLCPGVQLSTYEFVSIWAGLLSQFNFVLQGSNVPKFADAFTMSMKGSLQVKVTKRGM